MVSIEFCSMFLSIHREGEGEVNVLLLKKRIESLGNILEIKWGWLKGEPWLNKQRHASA